MSDEGEHGSVGERVRKDMRVRERERERARGHKGERVSG